jgi:hypothetical protein
MSVINHSESLKSVTILWDVMLCSSVEVHWCFREITLCVFMVEKKVKQETNFLLDLLFDHEHSGRTFLWSVGALYAFVVL